MPLTRRVLLPVAVAIAAVTALAPAGAPADSTSCARPRSKTLASTSAVRVYRLRTFESDVRTDGRRLYGCLRSTGKSLYLARAYDDEYYVSADYWAIRIAGRFVAWSEDDVDLSCGKYNLCPPGETGLDASIAVADLRLRKIARVEASVSDSGGLVVTKKGAIAWTEWDKTAQGSSLRVRARDSDGTVRTLDEERVERLSLKLKRDGTTVTWVKDGVTQSATLK